MLQALQRCPCMCSTGAEETVVMCCMGTDAQRLLVCSSHSVGNFAAEYDEAALTKLRDQYCPEIAWDDFFDELQDAFACNRVTTPSEMTVECTTSKGSHIRFTMQPTQRDVQHDILDSLLVYHHVHTNFRVADTELEETRAKQKELRLLADELTREERHLRESIARNNEHDAANKKLIQQYEQEIAQMPKTAAAVVDESDGEEEEPLCRMRNPLGSKDHKDYDLNLLKLVKARWISEKDSDPKAKYHSVARPYTSSELKKYTSRFTNTQRAAIWKALDRIEEWDYNVFSIQTHMSGDDNSTLANQPHGGALLITAYTLFFRQGCMQRFDIDEKILLNWLSVVEAGYHGNPYHNSMHAADVLHVCHYILSKGGLIEKCKLRPEDIFAAMFASIVHDYDHPGINNSFHVRTQTYLATLYNDRSVLENRHVSSVFELMKLPKFNVLGGFSEEQRHDIRDTVVEMVLATDMGMHASYVNQFKRRLAEDHDFHKKDDIRLALAMALKMSDISNCGRPQQLYLRWSNKLADEFYLQGDRERNHGLPCSPFMDRLQPAMAKGQIAFMNYIVIPMFDHISELLPNMHFSVELTEENKSYWAHHDDS